MAMTPFDYLQKTADKKIDRVLYALLANDKVKAGSLRGIDRHGFRATVGGLRKRGHRIINCGEYEYKLIKECYEDI